MAEYIGATGSVVLGAAGTGTDINVTKWDLDITRDMHDITKLGDSAPFYKQFIGGYAEWSGSFEGMMDSGTVLDDNNFDGAAVSATFTDGHANTYVGNCILSNVTITNDAQDVVRFSASFQGTDDLTISLV